MFKFRDLLILVAVVFGVVCGVYRNEIRDAARRSLPAVFYYVDAPAREAASAANHLVEVQSLQQQLADVRRQLADSEAQLAHQRDLFSGAENIIRDMGEKLSVSSAELNDVRYRHAQLLTRLKDLGNDVPSVLTSAEVR
jgi:chromosome segregation ATPase